MGDLANQLNELKTLLSSCAGINSKWDKSSAYSMLLQLEEHSTTDPPLLKSLADSSHILLSSMANDISDDDEEIAAQALKCMGFMIYHPSIVTGISGDDVDMVLSSLQKVILATRIKVEIAFSLRSFTITYRRMVNGVWCISVQQFSAMSLNAHIDSLVRAIIHALDNPTGSLSTTFEAMQAVMKLVTQLPEKMRETSNLWAPPIYRRLVSADKREKCMSERCLLKLKSTICPPSKALSKAVILDVKRKLLPALEGLLNQGMKIQAMQAWGWFTRLIGPYAMKNRHLINQLLKSPEQTFSDSDPQVKIASQVLSVFVLFQILLVQI
ncbi:Armadillo-like helical [Cynara cardunculus var. scolymus]|uniref:Armadillo-like helical n=1 Tax=Cynara cardunculus var. scolymus TaxID=59895 RepID=A0A118JVW9_CYNCS|nr:Armadillo-like helical [Cynara cardunculus var. scolymus]